MDEVVSYIKYDPRKEGVRVEFSIQCHTVPMSPFACGTCARHTRLPASMKCAPPGVVCLELFCIGELDTVEDQPGILSVALQGLQSKAGARLRTPLPLCEVGCVPPLTAVPIVLHEMNLVELGDIFFEDFGKSKSVRSFKGNDNGPKVAGSGGPRCVLR
ncbi:hypothetical protein Q4I28_004152 [Leishmania naiffi]|uniref:Uncharacterized protein n=1 Tax=Leishmania naiffi TaxID=5678 RepID=A0AAW3BQM0_9TRYP